jgi:hypothetical protein
MFINLTWKWVGRGKEQKERGEEEEKKRGVAWGHACTL